MNLRIPDGPTKNPVVEAFLILAVSRLMHNHGVTTLDISVNDPDIFSTGGGLIIDVEGGHTAHFQLHEGDVDGAVAKVQAKHGPMEVIDERTTD